MAHKGFFDMQADEPLVTGAPALVKHDRDAEKTREAFTKAEEMKKTLVRSMEAGTEPQNVLYRALEIIGLLTDDKAFTEKTTGILENVYGDIAQLSFIQDNTLTAQARIDELTKDYIDKARRGVVQQYKRTMRVEDALKKTLDELDNLQHARTEGKTDDGD